MAQGSFRSSQKGAKKANQNAAKFKKRAAKDKLTRLGNPVQLPKNTTEAGRAHLEEALLNRELSKKIGIAAEARVAGKTIQAGSKLEMHDIVAAGKAVNREKRRDEVKKKVGRVQEKLNALREKADAAGLI